MAQFVDQPLDGVWDAAGRWVVLASTSLHLRDVLVVLVETVVVFIGAGR